MASSENFKVYESGISKEDAGAFIQFLQTASFAILDFPETIAPIIASFLIFPMWLAFDVDASDPEQMKELYPTITLSEGSFASIKNGFLTKRPNACGDELCKGIRSPGPVQYEIYISTDRAGFNVGLGCYVGPRFCTRQHFTANRLCFHPGMGGGQFRIEGPGGRGNYRNANIGWNPPATRSKAPYSKANFTKFTIILRPTGKHTVEIRGSEDGQLYRANWKNDRLWNLDPDLSPPFGIYDGDIKHRGIVTYHSFSVTNLHGTSDEYLLGKKEMGAIYS